MTVIARRSARPTRLGLVALLVVVWALVGIGAANPAPAHTEMTSSTPANGTVLTSSPKTARLVFNEKVSPVAKDISLRAASGQTVDTGKAYPTKNTVNGTIAFRVRG